MPLFSTVDTPFTFFLSSSLFIRVTLVMSNTLSTTTMMMTNNFALAL